MNELTLGAARAALCARLTPVADTEAVAVATANGRVLAADVRSAVDMPNFDSAAMDGYAVRGDDVGGSARTTLTVIGRALAGHEFTGRLQRGQALSITTGAPLPAGADTVVMREDTTPSAMAPEGGTVRINRAVTAGSNVRPRGEHVHAGDVVLAAGRRLRAHDIGLLASVGIGAVAVHRPLRVAILSTGDELVDAPAALSSSAGFDANRPLLAALLAEAACSVVDLGICRDNKEAFAQKLDQAMQGHADVLITSGGAAEGDADVVRQHGVAEFIPLNIRPGRGLLFGRIGRDAAATALLGLPGNAVAAYVMYQLVVRPVLGHLAGAGPEPPLLLRLPLAFDVEGKRDRIEWRRARFVHSDGHGNGAPALEPLKEQGSAMLRTLSEADALIGVPPAGVRAGHTVDTIPLAALA